MRLDKYLKVSRIIKRRTVAKEIADQGRILINDKIVKSSSKVAPGDEMTINFGNKVLKVRVNQLLDSTKKEDATEMYTVISEEFKNEK